MARFCEAEIVQDCDLDPRSASLLEPSVPSDYACQKEWVILLKASAFSQAIAQWALF